MTLDEIIAQSDTKFNSLDELKVFAVKKFVENIEKSERKINLHSPYGNGSENIGIAEASKAHSKIAQNMLTVLSLKENETF